MTSLSLKIKNQNSNVAPGIETLDLFFVQSSKQKLGALFPQKDYPHLCWLQLHRECLKIENSAEAICWNKKKFSVVTASDVKADYLVSIILFHRKTNLTIRVISTSKKNGTTKICLESLLNQSKRLSSPIYEQTHYDILLIGGLSPEELEGLTRHKVTKFSQSLCLIANDITIKDSLKNNSSYTFSFPEKFPLLYSKIQTSYQQFVTTSHVNTFYKMALLERKAPVFQKIIFSIFQLFGTLVNTSAFNLDITFIETDFQLTESRYPPQYQIQKSIDLYESNHQFTKLVTPKIQDGTALTSYGKFCHILITHEKITTLIVGLLFVVITVGFMRLYNRPLAQLHLSEKRACRSQPS